MRGDFLLIFHYPFFCKPVFFAYWSRIFPPCGSFITKLPFMLIQFDRALRCYITCVGARPSCGKEKMWYGKTFVANGSRRYFVFSSCWNTFWSGHRFPVTNLLTCQNPNSGGRNWRERWGGGGSEGGGGGGVLPIYSCNLKGKGLAALTSPHSRAHSIGSLRKL